MPQTNFELINHAYSFSYSVTHSGGETFSLPQSDYGAYGHHVDAFFNSIPGTGQGGVSNLKAWFLSDLGLTWALQAGATTQIYNYMEQRFPIDTTTTGRGLIDLRGSSDWKHVIGDGIIAPTTLAGTGATHPYTEGIKRVYNTLKTAYPNMEWAIAGLPHLPYFMTYAPDPSISGQMEAAGQTPGFDWNNWDSNHPRGYYDQYYTWSNVPESLADYYIGLYETGMQQTILEECDPDWLCFDVRVPHQKNFPFYRSAYLPVDNYERNKKVAELAADYAQYYYKRSFAEISTVYPSRYDNPYDDPESYYDVSFTGASANSSNAYYPLDVLQYETIQAAAQGGCHGFLFSDPVPAMIEMACTASTAGLGDTGDSQSMIDSARNRARNMFSYILFGGSDNNGYEPDGGWTAGWVYNELRRFASNETIGILDRIRESVLIGDRGTLMAASNPGQNGWQRTIPPSKPRTDISQSSTNTTDSDDVYGEQNWPSVLGLVDCTPCQCREPNPDWSDPVCCPDPEANENCDCANNPFAYGCCDPEDPLFDRTLCCGPGLPFGSDDPICQENTCVPGTPGFSVEKCCGTEALPWGHPACPCACRECICTLCGIEVGGIDITCGWKCLYNSSEFSICGEEQSTECCETCECDYYENESACNAAGNGGGCLGSGGGSSAIAAVYDQNNLYSKLLQGTNVLRVERNRFIINRGKDTPIRDWSSVAYTSKYPQEMVIGMRNAGTLTVNNPKVSQDALRLFGEKDLAKHQNFGNFSP